MIAAIEWIPAGRANPNPSKYEYSRAEQEFLARVQAGDLDAQGGDAAATADDGADNGGEENAADQEADGSDEEWSDVEEKEEEESGNKVELPKVDLASLPADLKMDEYSDDEEDGDKEKDVGGLLIGKDAEEMMGDAFQQNGTTTTTKYDEDDGESSDSEDDDDLADIPDTREYMPLDMEGLKALGIGGGNLRDMPTGGDDEGGYTMEDLQNMTMNNNELLEEEDDEDEDEEDVNDIKLHDGDALVVVAKTEEDFASLEINVFDVQSSNLYVHHDIPLPSFPLCLALGSVVSGYQEDSDVKTGNYVAVGSFEPGIEIWNLDVMNALEPTIVLGGMDTSGAEDDWMKMQMMPTSTTVGSSSGGGKKKKKKKKGGNNNSSQSRGGLREGSHTDAVMGLSWNNIHAQVLASGSADGTVKLWDVTQTTSDGKGGGNYVRPSTTLTHHTDKVQSLAWHPSEGTLLATGGYDRKICLVDARSAAAVAGNAKQDNVKKAKLLADCEAIAWDPHNPQYLTAASEDGVVQCWDVRKFGQEPVWSMVAHEYGGVSDICYNQNVPGMLITCSIDKTVALWDTTQNNTNSSSPTPSPQPCGSKEMNVGKLHSLSCYPSAPWILACGGSGNELAIWDMESEDAIQKRFASRVNGGESAGVPARSDGQEEPDFEAVMALGDSAATDKALEVMNKSKKKKGKKKGKAHKKK